LKKRKKKEEKQGIKAEKTKGKKGSKWMINKKSLHSKEKKRNYCIK
jgi:hypothetical protein